VRSLFFQEASKKHLALFFPVEFFPTGGLVFKERSTVHFWRFFFFEVRTFPLPNPVSTCSFTCQTLLFSYSFFTKRFHFHCCVVDSGVRPPPKSSLPEAFPKSDYRNVLASGHFSNVLSRFTRKSLLKPSTNSCRGVHFYMFV